jgi:hypothetical protein
VAGLKVDLVDLSLTRLALPGEIKREHANYGANRNVIGDFGPHGRFTVVVRAAEVLAMERKLIRETGANNPAIGYNLTPRWQGSQQSARHPEG